MALHGLQLPHSKPAMEPAANPQPPVPQKLPPQPTVVMRADLEAQQRVMRADGSEFTLHYSSAVLDPRWLDLMFSEGWEHEEQANVDPDALL